jgi:hypothetical protein
MNSGRSENRESRRRKLARVAELFGVRVASECVCTGHSAPMDFVESWCYDRPTLSVVLGPRGGVKSFLAGFATIWDSATLPRHGTRILGGSLAQSEQVYDAIASFASTEVGSSVVSRLTKTRGRFVNGSDVSILAASSRSVRGPHVPSLRLDEVDEIDPDIREASLGMCMARHGQSASITMTSTWHRIGGPMSNLMDRGRAGEFPTFTFCAFEVLERCPDHRSGEQLERCPECPLMKWCHEGRDEHPSGLPKAKRSSGHYAIDSLIQKVRAVSLRIFEADYLCRGPKADGLWFTRFLESTHVTDRAEFDPGLPCYLAVDIGVFTGAVFFQVHSTEGVPTVRVFADYLSEGDSAETNARALIAMALTLCRGTIARAYADPAGKARNPVANESVLDIYARSGLPVEPWPLRGVLEGLETLESLISPADGVARLLVHPRCQTLIRAFRAYRRARRANQWSERPEDPQHPHEDVMDALRGGVMAVAGGPRVSVAGGGIDRVWTR